MGKDTEIRPIRLDSKPMLLECAEFAGLNMENAKRVLDGEIIDDDDIYREVVFDEVNQELMKAVQKSEGDTIVLLLR